jgi:stearoyl-CoA desaturase (delta-9 desaturase)
MAPTATGIADQNRAAAPPAPGRRPVAAAAALWGSVLAPFAALAAAVPMAWGRGLCWVDVAIAAGAYAIAGLGVTSSAACTARRRSSG